MLTLIMYTFSAIIYKESFCYLVEVPGSVTSQLEDAQYIPIRGMADKHPFKSTILNRRLNRKVFFINAALRKKINKGDGDKIDFEIELDPEDRTLPTPEDLEMILSEDSSLIQEFNRLSPSYRRSIIAYLEEAKQEGTRLKRIQLISQRMQERIQNRKKKHV